MRYLDDKIQNPSSPDPFPDFLPDLQQKDSSLPPVMKHEDSLYRENNLAEPKPSRQGAITAHLDGDDMNPGKISVEYYLHGG